MKSYDNSSWNAKKPNKAGFLGISATVSKRNGFHLELVELQNLFIDSVQQQHRTAPPQGFISKQKVCASKKINDGCL